MNMHLQGGVASGVVRPNAGVDVSKQHLDVSLCSAARFVKRRRTLATRGRPVGSPFACRLAIAGMALLSSLTPLSLHAATPVHKCVVNGTVTYQNSACATGGGPRPTVEQLNAERRKQLQAAEAAASAAGAASRPSATATATSRPSAAAEPVSPQAESSRCDGRTTCSQMTSCAEAKYFLAHCPGVTMDGDHNGIPCERQWCSR